MYFPNLPEKDMEKLADRLNSLLENKKFTIIYIQKSNGDFKIERNCTNFTARVNTGCDSSVFIEIRYSYNNTKNWAAFEIHTAAEISITHKTVGIVTKHSPIDSLRNIIIHLY